MIEIDWQWKKFEQLSVYQLHDILKLRQQVFVIEQNCIYPDIDELDKYAWHLLGSKEGALHAYSRVYFSNKLGLVLIGRVLTSIVVRGQTIGQKVMRETLSFIQREYSGMPIKISAQSHLESFYTEFGFVKTSEPYDEDGIIHIDMQIID